MEKTKNKTGHDLRVLFIAPYDYGSFAVRTLQAVLKEKGYSTSIIFFKELIFNNLNKPTKEEERLLLEQIKKINPNIICLSIRSPFFSLMKHIIVNIRKSCDAFLVLGGTHATVCPEECINYADYVCRGEAEICLPEFIEKIENGERIDNVPNFWIKTRKGIIKNELTSLLEDLDKIPLFDYSDKNKFYIENNRVSIGDQIKYMSKYYIMAGRGCPFACTYCTNSFFHKLFKGKGRYVRFRSVDNVINELMHAKKKFQNLKEVYFVDEVFALDRKWILEFAEKYKKKINLPFGCEFYPTTVEEKTISELKKAGLFHVTMGIQSGSERVRKEVFKRFTTDEQIINAARIFKRNGINPSYDLILDNFYETEQDMDESLNFLLKIPRPYNLNVYSLVNFPNTDLTNKLIKDRMINKYNAEKALKQWRMSLRYKRANRQKHYNSILSLLSKQFIPYGLIRFFSKSKYFKKNPVLLVFITSVSNKIKVVYSGMMLILKGRVSFYSIKYYLKNFRNISN